MTLLRVGIGLIWIASLLAGRALWSDEAASANGATSARITAHTAWTGGEAVKWSPVEGGDPNAKRVDLFGNEVEDALADYRFDLRGDVYERHSPDTAVQKLGSPSS